MAAAEREIEAVVRRAVRECAEQAGVVSRFARPRRASDVLIVLLHGPRRAVLQVPGLLLSALPRYGLEIIRGRRRTGSYRLMLAVTLPLPEQRQRPAERRAKLRRLPGAG